MVDSVQPNVKYSGRIFLRTSKLFFVLFTSLLFPWQLSLVGAVNETEKEAEINYLSLYNYKEGSASIVDGLIRVAPNTIFEVILVGSNLNSSLISFSDVVRSRGASCDDDRFTKVKPVTVHSVGVGRATVTLDFKNPHGGVFYICLKEDKAGRKWKHQGDKFLSITVLKKSFQLPGWLQIILVGILMMLSGLFSGLNLGLMSLDPNELKIVSNSGSVRQKRYAKKILPVRCHGNFLLCTLLLGNTLVNSSFTILLDSLAGNGMVAVIGSTFAIVIFGEIVPQSICSRYGLAVGAHTIYLTKMFMLITFPLSFPVSKLLDCILGKELGNIYNKQQLLEMLKLQSEYNDIEQNEVGIISGALKYGSKKVEEVMTQLEDCYLLDEEAILDFQTMSSIIKTGYSRIPIYSGERAHIVAVLFVKDLAFVDPDDCIPLLSVIKFYNHPVHKVFFDTTLDKMLEEFKQGTTHLSIVLKINEGEGGDPFYECIGIITLEDVLEEIIQAEIVDETDVYIDNVSGKKVHRKHHNEDFSLFLPAPADSQPKISAQLAFAIFQYLSTAVDAFNSNVISRTVLKKIIEHPGVVEEREAGKDGGEAVHLYKQGVHSDCFTLILQGRIEVTVGLENINFEDGPFSVFGVNALLSESGQPFLPDYTVKVVSSTQYLRVSRSLYRSAVRASKMEKENKMPDIYQEYDEIFWTHLKKTETESPGVADLASNKSDRSSLKSRGSMRSYDTDGGTPSKLSHKGKTSLLSKLTPNFDRKKNSPTPADIATANIERKKRNELSSSSQENPLISNESVDKGGLGLVKERTKVSTCSQDNPLLSSESEETGKLLNDTSSVTSDAHA